MMDLSVSDVNLTDQKGVGFDSLLISAQDIAEKSHIEKNMGNSDITTDNEITSDFNCLDDVGILQSPPEVGLFSNTGVMDCLPDLQPSTEFPTLESVDSDEVTALPFHGPLGDPEANIETDVLDSNATAGVCGLRNLGNTCFMNSGLQCIFNNKRFIQFFLENNVEACIKDVLTNKFAEVLRKVWSGQFSVLHLSEFKEAIGSSYPQFRDYRQHDCQEFLALLLDTMHEQINVVFQNGVKLDCSGLCETALPAINKSCVHNLPSFSRTDNTVCSQLSLSVESAKDSEAEICTKDNSVLSHNLSDHRTNVETCAKKCDRNCVDELNEQFRTIVKNPNPELPGTSAKVFSEITDDPSIYEKNTEKMADLLINNRQFERHLNKNELEENLVTSDVLLKQKLYNVQKRQCFPITSSSCDSKLEKNELASKLNVGRKIPNIDDFVKDTKILNTNVLISEEPNNLFKFDSEKFPKHENNRLRETVDNLGEILEFDTKQSSLKRVKVTNIIQEQKDLTECNPDDSKSKMCISKRIKIEDMESPQTISYSPTLEQDSIMDTEQTNEADSEESSQSGETNPVSSEQRWILLPDEELKANTVWENYKVANKSVVVDTFHGQFRSTVVCSECSHVSITYEPFMYLPVPLPHALERQIVITYIPNKGRHPVRYLVNVKKHERVKKIKEALLELVEDCPNEIMLAEVFENHISKILDDNTLVRQVNDISRTVYAFEIAQYSKQHDSESKLSNDCSEGTLKSSTGLPAAQTSQTWDDATPTQTVENPSLTKCESILAPPVSPNSGNAAALGCSSGTSTVACGDYSKPLQHPESELCDIGNLFGDSEITESNRPSSLQTNENFNTVQWHPCAICLEDLADYNLMIHPNCQCILCKSCIEVSCKHYGGDSFICPVCSTSVSPSEDFVPVTKLEDFKYKISMIPVPVVVRHDFLEDENQNSQFKTLVGHPGLLKLPTCLPAAELYEHVDKTVPFISPYSLLLVDGQGKNCSRCLFNQHCSGCEIARVGDIRLQPCDSLAVRYLDVGKETLESIARVSDHKSMQQKRHKNTLNLYDCLEAFSERENLDENSPWFCPECCQNQRAIKSLSVWRFPEVLIVCLKRFVFHDYTSIKLDEKVAFPLDGLDLSSYASGPISDDLIYDLQACVCHVGNLSSGHYTSYTKHAITNEWYYYNDETVCKRVPKTEDSMNEYILFYQKR